jgi:DNA modification methylase
VPELGIVPAYTTRRGRAYHADAMDVLRRLPSNSIALVMTSPPFALRRKKAYGNVAASEYVEWFWPFAREIYRILKPEGSFVLELGGAWNPGSGTRSLYQYELILRLSQMFCLAQEFYWYNPSRLPTPAEWVTIRRTRVKDAVNMLWWLSKTQTPRADNRQVLRPYSRSMRRLLKDGYKAARRPSQHDIGPHFRRDNGGAIPPNLLTIPNTRSNDEYLRDCRQAGLPIHPARFPPGVPEFFIRFLTEPEAREREARSARAPATPGAPRSALRAPRQIVLDPFAGSNVTGQVAETLERSWISIEIDADYVAGSKLRFPDAVPSSSRPGSAAG